MFLRRKLPPLSSSDLLFQHSIQNRSYASLRKTEDILKLAREPPKKRRGPPRGSPVDPNDPTKTISRAKLINFRPRGKTVLRSRDKSTFPFLRELSNFYPAEGDLSGRMVHDDVILDVNGIPEKLPGYSYQKLPLINELYKGYDYYARRDTAARTLLSGTELEIQMLEREVEKFVWDMKLRIRAPPAETDFEINRKIVDILEGTELFGF